MDVIGDGHLVESLGVEAVDGAREDVLRGADVKTFGGVFRGRISGRRSGFAATGEADVVEQCGSGIGGVGCFVHRHGENVVEMITAEGGFTLLMLMAWP